MLSFTKNRDQPRNRQICLTEPLTIRFFELTRTCRPSNVNATCQTLLCLRLKRRTSPSISVGVFGFNLGTINTVFNTAILHSKFSES